MKKTIRSEWEEKRGRCVVKAGQVVVDLEHVSKPIS
jgi:hypothetical protein